MTIAEVPPDENTQVYSELSASHLIRFKPEELPPLVCLEGIENFDTRNGRTFKLYLRTKTPVGGTELGFIWLAEKSDTPQLAERTKKLHQLMEQNTFPYHGTHVEKIPFGGSGRNFIRFGPTTRPYVCACGLKVEVDGSSTKTK